MIALQSFCLGCINCIIPKKHGPESRSFLHRELNEDASDTNRRLPNNIPMASMPTIDSKTALKESSPSNQEAQRESLNTEAEERLEIARTEEQEETQQGKTPNTVASTSEGVTSEELDQEPNIEHVLARLYDSCDDTERKQWMQTALEGLVKAQEINKSSLDGYERIYNETKAPHKLTVHFRSYTTATNSKVNISRSEWYVFCTPEQFIKYVYTPEEQKKVDKGIELDTIHEKLVNNEDEYCSVNYMGYKKVWITAARDFTYVKHYKKLNEKTWSDCSRSVTIEGYPPVEGKVRAGMVLVGHYIERDDDPVTGQIRSRVRHYSEIDVKINTPDILAKPFVASTLRKTVEDIDKRIKELFPQ